MTDPIAIVGQACCYPDARSPRELWENVLSQRRAFRRIPAGRLRIEDYFDADRAAPDSIYSTEAAVIEGYEFDRVRFRVAGSTFRSVDLSHWLALDVSAQAFDDAGFDRGAGLPSETTAVFVGNTLTGDISRSNVLRLRWPYVRRILEAALIEEGWHAERRRAFVGRLESSYKESFPPVNEESLAGGLSNTIAGRICNHFDLKGGGYTIDGACASSLLAIAHACSALAAGDLDMAVAGGVDLSLDPFELVGFAKAGALAAGEMRVFDRNSAGFLPGEGCGFVVLMRLKDALDARRRVHAVIRGWGVSSDGGGGITRPEVEGQLLAISRAYRRAGYGVETVPYFEGHGTGTSVGDATELLTLSRAIRRDGANPAAPPAAIGSVKANIGHTKAAAGVAGLLKAVAALKSQVLPPTTGCAEPHAELTHERAALRVLGEAEPWPAGRPLRAGVSAMGFGGINVHLTVEGVESERRGRLGSEEKLLDASAQDAELFLLGARGAADLREQVERLLAYAASVSYSELTDLAAELHRQLGATEVRAAVVASSPRELAERLETLRGWLRQGVNEGLRSRGGAFLSTRSREPRIGFLFPGQGSPVYLHGNAWQRRFAFVRDLYAASALPRLKGGGTEVAQPSIVTASLAGLRVLERMGVKAVCAVGHSLGELTALHWGGVFDEQTLLDIATQRGSAMASQTAPAGAMASIEAGQPEAQTLINGEGVVVAALNSPRQTVISGEATAVETVMARARGRGLRAVRLPVSHAFHSPLMSGALPAFTDALSRRELRALRRQVFSTVTGSALTSAADARALLLKQLTAPVRFVEAVQNAVGELDLLLEVGPGQILRGLLDEFVSLPVISLDAGGQTLRGLCLAAGAAYAAGADIHLAELFTGRFSRRFDLNWQPRFINSPCELPPVPAETDGAEEGAAAHADELPAHPLVSETEADTPGDVSPPALDLVRRLVAQRTELPLETVTAHQRLLADLHLNSIAVSQLVVEAARGLGLPPPSSLLDFSNVTVGDAAQALEELKQCDTSAVEAAQPAGVDSWFRPFVVNLVERPPGRRANAPDSRGEWQFFAPADSALADSLREVLGGVETGGVVVCLPPEPDERHAGLLLEGARAALKSGRGACFVLVQHGAGAASFARTLHLEAPEINTCVVTVPEGHPQAARWVSAEVATCGGYAEAHYDEAGTRYEPRLVPVSPDGPECEAPLNGDDVLLVTGGGKGIGAECALSLAKETGASLVLLGRSKPETDGELAANLDRMRACGIRFKYLVADVADAESVSAAVEEATKSFGQITALLHAAGTNTPCLLSSLDASALREALAPKLNGARNVLAALDPRRLRLLVVFGSLISRTGMRGEADYALANEWLVQLTERWQSRHPHCRCLAVEWSVWSGAGMGERLGRIETLRRQGIDPIPIAEGVRLLRDLLRRDLPATAVTVTGRFGETPTLRLKETELPLLRFLEHRRVFYPGVELVVDTQLAADTDPYLQDHIFRGDALFPAVMGLEAMAQAVTALAETDAPPVFEQVKFNRPVAVANAKTETIRVAALVRETGRIDVALRCASTGFQVDHFSAVCRFGGKTAPKEASRPLPAEPPPAVPLVPERDLYGGLLFQGKRFQRLRSYLTLSARECVAEVMPDNASAWFGPYIPSATVLGDPASRDALLHSIQACVPDETILPVGVERLTPCALKDSATRFVHARERSREGRAFIYDVVMTDAAGAVLESWEGLCLQAVGGARPSGGWVEPLLGPYLERRVQDLFGGPEISVAAEVDDSGERRAHSDRLIGRALGRAVGVQRRPDGRPEAQDRRSVSTAHAGDVTVAVGGAGRIACDVEPVSARPAAVWRDLLGVEGFALAQTVAREAKEALGVAATRVWTAKECLKKAGAGAATPLLFARAAGDGWVLLASGALTVGTYVAEVRSRAGELVLAILAENEGARARV